MAIPTPELKILAHTRSTWNDIFVIEQDRLREMWFRSRERFYLQSRMDRDRPDDLALVYTRLFLAALMWNPKPARILMIGLGGGVLPRFLTGSYPDTEIDIVEVDARVVKLARRYFEFRENRQVRVFVEDGRTFVKQGRTRYDLVYLDAFKGGCVPYHLKTVEFYREIARSMTAGGLLATNLYGKSNDLKPRDRKTLEAVFRDFVVYEDAEGRATVGLAGSMEYSPKQVRQNIAGLPERVRRNLSWNGKLDMIPNGNGIESGASVFQDDFEASEFFRVVKRNNRDDPFYHHPYPIRNSG